MTRVRQNDPALPPFPRRPRPYVEAETAIIRTLARGGQTVDTIIAKLAEAGFTRTAVGVSASATFLDARRERAAARASEDAARAVAEKRAAHHDYRTQGVRHPDVPGVTLPRVSLQSGCVSFPEAWAR